jgi:hypothetical protein
METNKRTLIRRQLQHDFLRLVQQNKRTSYASERLISIQKRRGRWEHKLRHSNDFALTTECFYGPWNYYPKTGLISADIGPAWCRITASLDRGQLCSWRGGLALRWSDRHNLFPILNILLHELSCGRYNPQNRWLVDSEERKVRWLIWRDADYGVFVGDVVE